MQRFHANLYDGKMGKAAALRESQQWLRDLPLEEARRMLEAKRKELFRPNRMAATDAVIALLQIPARGSQPFAHPLWWGAFQCIGAGWNPMA